MKLTRTGFNLLVVAWLIPIVALDIISNTTLTGDVSDIYYYKTMADGLLIAYALFQAFGRGQTVTKHTAQNDDTVASFEKIAAWEYVYCLLLAVYAAVNWFGLHMINKESTGLTSIGSLIWSFVSLAVLLLSLIQFWHLKSGAIVQVKKRIVAN